MVTKRGRRGGGFCTDAFTQGCSDPKCSDPECIDPVSDETQIPTMPPPVLEQVPPSNGKRVATMPPGLFGKGLTKAAEPVPVCEETPPVPVPLGSFRARPTKVAEAIPRGDGDETHIAAVPQNPPSANPTKAAEPVPLGDRTQSATIAPNCLGAAVTQGTESAPLSDDSTHEDNGSPGLSGESPWEGHGGREDASQDRDFEADADMDDPLSGDCTCDPTDQVFMCEDPMCGDCSTPDCLDDGENSPAARRGCRRHSFCGHRSCCDEQTHHDDLLISWEEGGIAVMHTCGKNKCIAFVEEAHGWVCCYHISGERLTREGWLSGKVCFAHHGEQDAFGMCSVSQCLETELHIHAHEFGPNCEKGLPPTGPLLTLLECPACEQPPMEAIQTAQTVMRSGLRTLPSLFGKSREARWGRLVKVGDGRIICEPSLQLPRGILDNFAQNKAIPNTTGMPGPGSFKQLKSHEGETPSAGALSPGTSPVTASPATARRRLGHSLDLEAAVTPRKKRNTRMTTVLDVEGICCPSEVPIIDSILQKLPGIEKVSTNVTARTVTVVHDESAASAAELVEALNAASLGASLRRGKKVRRVRKLPSVQLQVSGLLWLLSLASIFWEDTEAVHLRYAAVGAAVLGLPRIGKKAWGALRHGILDINCLMVIATCGAFVIGDFVEGGAVVFWFGLSEYLEEIATSGARSALESVLELRPEEAITEAGEKVPVEEVAVGDRLIVRSGEKVPVDAVVLQGSSSLDESALTGESVPVRKVPGSSVSGGTINVGGGCLVIEAEVEAKDSSVARMVKLIEDANNSRSHTEALVEKFAKVYTPTLIVSAVLCASISWLLDKNRALEWLRMALVLLVMACPCALVISTPVAYVSALTCAATHNVVIRGGEFIEALGRLRTICFDKTGTLTEGRFCVRKVLGPFEDNAHPLGLDLAELAGLAASVEQRSTHPLARALVAHAHAEGAEVPGEVEDFLEKPGEGVQGTVAGHHVQLGSHRLAERMGWLQGDTAAQVAELETVGHTVCLLGIDGRLAAAFGVADAPRAEAAEGVAALKQLGVQAVMLTGDRQRPAELVATQLGLDGVRAELLPGDKAEVVHQLKAVSSTRHCCSRSQGDIVAMLGDGINDAAALATADVGIAMGAAGTQVAVESAHMVLMDSDLRKLAVSVRLSRFTVKKIKQNIIFALASKFVMVILAMTGHASIWGALIADLGAMLAVTLNASRVLGFRKRRSVLKGAWRRCRGKQCGGKQCCAPQDPVSKPPARACTGACCEGKRPNQKQRGDKGSGKGKGAGEAYANRQTRHEQVGLVEGNVLSANDVVLDLDGSHSTGCKKPCCCPPPAPPPA